MPGGNRHKLLLVDDEQLILDVCGTVLESSGFEVVRSRNARLGLEIFRQDLYSICLVISDLLLPDMSGQEMVYTMRQYKPNLKAVFLSGFSPENVIPEISAAGTRLLIKPFTSDRLLQTVRNTLEMPIAASSIR